jgi:hypothetical protein
MPRFVTNRWCTFILALSLCFGSIASMSAISIADMKTGDGSGGSLPPGAPGDPTAGDPDIPVPSVKGSVPRGAALPASSVSTSRAVGDSVPLESVMMWRLRIVLQSLGVWYVRF